MREDRLFDIEYGYWFNLFCERFYRHVDVCLNLVQLVGGSAAAMGAMQQNSQAVVAAGLALALCAALGILVSPSVKVERHCLCKTQWRTLRGHAHNLDDNALLCAVTNLQGIGPSGIGALAMPAYNATLHAIGKDEATQRLGVWQWVAQAMA